MHTRVVACLDVLHNRVVKGVRFVGLRVMGGPVRTAHAHILSGVEELVVLDIGATVGHPSDMMHVAHGVSVHASVPVTIGGGIRQASSVRAMMGSGADKVSVNTHLACRLGLLPKLATRHGAQCLVGCVDARMDRASMAWSAACWGGSIGLRARAQDWARAITSRGAGEVVLTSIDRDGTRTGYDVPLARCVAGRTHAPFVISGGAGGSRDCLDAACLGKPAGVLLAGALHEGTVRADDLRAYIRSYAPHE